jgi:hypothetical protein
VSPFSNASPDGPVGVRTPAARTVIERCTGLHDSGGRTVTTMTDAIRWVEIPTERIERAAEFYSTVLDRELREAPGTDGPYLLFETADDGVGGALFEAGTLSFEGGESLSFAPGDGGPTVYLAVEDVAAALGRVEPAGGTVLVGPRPVDDGGDYAVVRDTEGNRVGLMSA